MKKFALLFSILLIATTISAQNTFSRKDNIMSLGIGFGYNPAIDLKWEINVLDGICQGKGGIGVGALFGTDFDDAIILGAQSNFHYEFVDNLDTYAGISLGANFWESNRYGSSHLYLGAQIGTRYYFNNNWAIMAEFGYGLSFAKIGCTYKF